MMRKTLVELRKFCVIGFVGGSDFSKQIEQLGPDGTCFLHGGPIEPSTRQTEYTCRHWVIAHLSLHSFHSAQGL